MQTLVCLLLLIAGTVAGYCPSNNDCGSCTQDSQFWIGCRWCPLTNDCHHYGDPYNDCYGDQQVTGVNQCLATAEPGYLTYNPYLALEMAKMSALAYMQPNLKDKKSTHSVIEKEFHGKYELVEFIHKECDLLFDYADCAAAISYSQSDNTIVVAFRGSAALTQILEQVLQFLTGMTPFSATGGEVLTYNYNAHESLYSCIKSALEGILSRSTNMRIITTGHSFGGAQAQLFGANLVADGVIRAEDIDVYTFGSPRVGDQAFAYNYDRMMGNSWRVTNRWDLVPQIVPTSIAISPHAYHTRREIYYDTTEINPSDSYTMCMDNEDSDCSYGNLICLTCFDEHLQYFLPGEINRYIQDKVSESVGSAPIKSTRESCESFMYQ